ncbi:hypothetical protein Hanom_Chr12g01172901 [Helianthus anomalus]
MKILMKFISSTSLKSKSTFTNKIRKPVSITGTKKFTIYISQKKKFTVYISQKRSSPAKRWSRPMRWSSSTGETPLLLSRSRRLHRHRHRHLKQIRPPPSSSLPIYLNHRPILDLRKMTAAMRYRWRRWPLKGVSLSSKICGFVLV